MNEQMKGFRHDLKGIVGNLKAIEFLLFSAPAGQNQAEIRAAYQSVLGKLDGLLKRMAEQGNQLGRAASTEKEAQESAK